LLEIKLTVVLAGPLVLLKLSMTENVFKADQQHNSLLLIQLDAVASYNASLRDVMVVKSLLHGLGLNLQV